MNEGLPAGPADDVIAELRRTLREHGVSFAVLFGSAVRDHDEPRDLDVAVEFEDRRPSDDGYSDAYLRLYTALDDRLPYDVDLVDVHTASPEFLRLALDRGRVLVGTDARRDELREDAAGDAPSVADARERVAAAVDRLHEGGRGG